MSGVAGRDLDYVLKMGGVMLLITAFGAVSASSRSILASNVSQNFGAELRSDLFKKIQTLSFKNIDRFERASLITRLTNDVTQVQVFANGLMRIFVKSPLLAIGGLIMATRLNLHLSVVLGSGCSDCCGIYCSKSEAWLPSVSQGFKKHLTGLTVL